MVSPLRLHEILIGKMVPPMLIGLFTATLYLIVIPTFCGVPFVGPVVLWCCHTKNREACFTRAIPKSLIVGAVSLIATRLRLTH
jgi:ABC-type Na+ efflux pump permease subunit